MTTERAYIEVYRCSYQRDPITRSNNSYTKWEFWLNGKMVKSGIAGQFFATVRQFKFKYTIQFKEYGISVKKPTYIRHNFKCQRA